MEIFQILGRFHPLILHMPIGILVLAFLMEWMSRKEKFVALGQAVGFALLIGMWSAIVAAISGYILSLEGGYDETILNRHQWLGIGTAVFSVLIYFLHQRKKSKIGKRFYFPFFVILLLCLMITGHLGGSLTHGSDFLTAPLYEQETDLTPTVSNVDNALVFQDVVAPIFKQKCNRCHNPSKIKGDLLLTTKEGILKGGETGAFFIEGDASNSLFLQQIHLPLEDKKHMPPKGKKQLTKNEIALLEWWVNEGGSFDKKVNELNPTDEIKSILTKRFPDKTSVFSLSIEPAPINEIQKLRNNGMVVNVLAKDKPFLSVNLRNRNDLNKKTFQQLNSISEQLIELDLSDTNMSDDLLSYLKEFPHLTKLFLQKTKVSSNKLSALENLEYLSYLNLYDTEVDDNAMTSLSKIKNLKKLFLWESNVTKKGIQQLQITQPQLQINSGVAVDVFGKSKLGPPAIIVENDIFKDSTMVAFEINFKGVQLHYTLDGSEPDSTSTIYSKPFPIFNSTEVKVMASKEGWENSIIADRTLVHARYQVANAKLNASPNEKYKANGPNSLIDFKKGTTAFTDGEWLGYQGESFSTILDLEKESKISSVSVGALEDTNSWIFFPKGIKISVSNDGKQFKEVAEKSIPTSIAPSASNTKNFTVPLGSLATRFIKVEVNSNLKNPTWHPNSGEPCWVFVDEIMVE